MEIFSDEHKNCSQQVCNIILCHSLNLSIPKTCLRSFWCQSYDYFNFINLCAQFVWNHLYESPQGDSGVVKIKLRYLKSVFVFCQWKVSKLVFYAQSTSGYIRATMKSRCVWKVQSLKLLYFLLCLGFLIQPYKWILRRPGPLSTM